MPWARFDERFPSHRKIRRLSDAAFRLHVSGICWASEYLTDGRIATDDLEDVAEIRKPESAVTELVKSGRWHEPGHECESEHCFPISSGWLIHDYLDYNPSKADVDATRSWDRKRQSLYRDKPLVEAIKKRDKDRCRYCGQMVNWTDRRSPLGGQLDHVIPRGPNTLENIVVACRGCNTRKTNRTPDEAGMPLLDAGALGPASKPKPKPASSDSLDPASSDVLDPIRPVPNRPVPSKELSGNAAQIVDAYVRGARSIGAPDPEPNLCARVGKQAKAMLSSHSFELLSTAAFNMATKGWHDLAVEVQQMAAATAPTQNKATQRINQGLAVVRRLEAETRGEIA